MTDQLVNADTGEIIAEMTPDEARDITNRMRTAAGVLTELYVDAYTRRAWAALGHASWDAYLAAEFGDFHIRLPREERDEVIGSLRSAGLSIRAIAATGVASKKTVERTIAASGVAKDDTCVTGTDGKTYNAVAEAAARRAAEAKAEAPAKCTDGFDCAATPGADGLCVWHRQQRAKNADQDPPSGAAGSGADPSPAPDPTPDASPSVAAGTGGGDQPAVQPSGTTLPDDWRDRIGRVTHLLSLDPQAVAAAVNADDADDLSRLSDWLFAYRNHRIEQQEN